MVQQVEKIWLVSFGIQFSFITLEEWMDLVAKDSKQLMEVVQLLKILLR